MVSLTFLNKNIPHLWSSRSRDGGIRCSRLLPRKRSRLGWRFPATATRQHAQNDVEGVLVQRIGVGSIWDAIVVGVGHRWIGTEPFSLEFIIESVSITVRA